MQKNVVTVYFRNNVLPIIVIMLLFSYELTSSALSADP